MTNNKNIQSGYRNGIGQWEMFHDDNEHFQNRKEGIEQQNWEKIRTLGVRENYKYLGILKADTIRRSRWEGKKIKENQNKKISRNQVLQHKSLKGISTCANSLGTILKRVKRRTQTNGLKDQTLMTMGNALHPSDSRDCVCQEKKEEDDSLALTIA